MTLPVTLISGYLGSGKTTLVNHLLRNAGGLRLAVLVNEFGELPIDADLIEAEDDTLISIAGGCVCCSFGDDLSQALKDLRTLSPMPEHVLIETSGVALPGSVVLLLGLMSDFDHEGTIVLTNAETILAQSEDAFVGDTVKRQLSDADLVVLNKTDLVDACAVEAVANWLINAAPQATIVKAEHGKLPVEVLLQSYLSRPVSRAPAPHLDMFETAQIAVNHPVDPESVAKRLAAADLGLVRAKGFVRGPNDQMATVQVVGRRWHVTPAPTGVAAGLVVIGHKPVFDIAAIKAALA